MPRKRDIVSTLAGPSPYRRGQYKRAGQSLLGCGFIALLGLGWCLSLFRSTPAAAPVAQQQAVTPGAAASRASTAQPPAICQTVKEEWHRGKDRGVLWDVTVRNAGKVACKNFRYSTRFSLTSKEGSFVVPGPVGPGETKTFKNIKDTCGACAIKYVQATFLGAEGVAPASPKTPVK